MASPRSLRPVPDIPPRAIVYVRVSSVMGREDLASPELQEHAARQLCQRKGYSVLDVVTDIDKSASTKESWRRRSLDKTIGRVEAREADVIVVYRWSRAFRNLRDYVIHVARIESAHGLLEAALEEADPATAAGLLQRDLFMILAQWEARKIGEQWNEAHARRWRNGLPHSGRVRFGYRYDPTTKTYSPDPVTGPMLVETYERYVGGWGRRQLLAWLSAMGGVNPETDRPWSQHGMIGMLDTGFAAGLIRRQADARFLPGQQEPLISKRLWEAYRRERERRGAERAGRRQAPVSPLTGLVVCEACRALMVHKRDRRTRASGNVNEWAYWACQNVGCTSRGFYGAVKAERAVLDWLAPLAVDVEEHATAAALVKAQKVGARADRARLQRELVALDTQMVELTRQLGRGLVVEQAFIVLRDEILASQAMVRGALDRTVAEAEAPSPARGLARGLLRDWASLPLLDRREALRRWGVEVLVHKGNPAQAVVTGRWERA